MNKLTLSLGSELLELRTDDCRSPSELSKLIQSVFQTKEEILGVTDSGGKFYELQYAWRNIKTFNNHKLAVITGRETTGNVSFGSRRSQRSPVSRQLKKSRCLGKINDVQTFRKFLPEGLSIIVTLKENDSITNIPFDYYRATGSPRWLELWSNNTLVLDCQIGDNYHIFFEGVLIYLKKITSPSITPTGYMTPDEVMNNEAKQTMILDAFGQLFEEGVLSELQFYKKKTLLLEKPHYYTHRFFTGQTIDRSELIQRIRQDFNKQKQQVKLLQMISNSPNKKEVPLLVRKDSNNRIEKVTTEQQLTLEQQQVLNLLLELQLKGLITESEVQAYQKHALNYNKHLMKLVRQYYEEEYDQVELTRRLKKMLAQRREEKKLIL